MGMHPYYKAINGITDEAKQDQVQDPQTQTAGAATAVPAAGGSEGEPVEAQAVSLPDRPANDARKGDWQAYADALGLEYTDNDTIDQLKEATAEAEKAMPVLSDDGAVTTNDA